MPSSVMMALVSAGTLNSSEANLSTAVNGVASGTLSTLKGSLGSDVSVILNVTLLILLLLFGCAECKYYVTWSVLVEAASCCSNGLVGVVVRDLGHGNTYSN